MKIVIDDKIPFIRGVFEPYAEVVYRPGGAIDAETLREADALVIRTRTRCDEALLDGSRVRIVATATIGYDHIDCEYCRRRGIRVATAAGCNARGVLQWVCAALGALGVEPRSTTLGIVGVGNVGGAVRTMAEAAGFGEVICCDPPRVERGERGTEHFVPLGTLLERADVVTTHVLLDDSTRGMMGAEAFGAMR
ncbi:MAG: 4-phosphoerythronate dehydrogenase, partial [Rikenella sp.]|nr:4-phosphoerythronate dehydrogenase [Rikenella sp.]